MRRSGAFLAAFVALAVALACTKEVPVVRTVVVEKTVQVPVERTVEVVRTVQVPVQVIVTPTPIPSAPAPAPEPKVYRLGIFEEPKTRNFWNYFAGPGGSVWTGYVLDGVSTSLYTYSDQRFDWVPLLADGFPTALTQETVGGKTFWTSQVRLKKGARWSDGIEITADDFVFVVNTALDLQLTGNWAASVDPGFVDRVEAIDPHTLKVFFKASDDQGNPQTAGLAKWQFGLAFTPILPKHYWEPIVKASRQAGDVKKQQEQLFSHVPQGEPTAGGYVTRKWEPGAFIQADRDPNWFRRGVKVVEYEGGAYQEIDPRSGGEATYYGPATGARTLEFEIGPHADTSIFNIYKNQDSAILALTKGEIDYVFNPVGLGKGFQDRVKATSDLKLITNPANNVRYLGFNVRKQPMSNAAFRQAVATVIDKEFVAETILNGSAVPTYSMVPEGNGAWHNTSVPKLGKGLSRAERIAQAVKLLKDAGFTYEAEPKLSADGRSVDSHGKGLKMPDGNPVPELEILAPSPGYDPLRSTFALFIERWLNELGIPTRAKLTGLNVIADTLFSETASTDVDMWILGWSLSLFPGYMEQYFHSRNADGGFNWGGYSNPAFDELALSFLSETDLEQARAKVFKMQDFLAQELPYVMLFSTPIVDAYRPSVVEFPYTSVLGGLQFVSGLQQEALID
jgi:ABC-type transport system substrate-binding protein